MNKLLTPAELAGLLGLATQAIYNCHSAGARLPPPVRIDRLVRFRLPDVEAWIAAQAEHIPPAACQPRRSGRPTKAEQVARRQGGLQ